ncbi:MAG: polyhydroxyalkanoate synthesis repressor PhaR [Magnetococcus sp. DMHC-6]
MSEPRIIKKYPNRRLYDTVDSCYITLEGIRKLVTDAIPFKVIDNHTGEVITRSILLQIINEQEEKGSPMLSSDLLTDIIRFQGDALQNTLSSYLEKSLKLFTDQQIMLRDQLLELPPDSMPISLFDTLLKNNLQLWQHWQKNLLPSRNNETDKE